MLLAKAGAHKFYETVRETLPRLCQEAGGTVDADKLEAFIVGQLNSSALDAEIVELQEWLRRLWAELTFDDTNLSASTTRRAWCRSPSHHRSSTTCRI